MKLTYNISFENVGFYLRLYVTLSPQFIKNTRICVLWKLWDLKKNILRLWFKIYNQLPLQCLVQWINHLSFMLVHVLATFFEWVGL